MNETSSNIAAPADADDVVAPPAAPTADGSLARATRWVRRGVMVALAGCIVWAGAWMMLSSTGRQIRNDPRAFGRHVREQVQARPVAAPAIYIGVYVLASLLALPMWWILVIGGACFAGPRFGVIPAVVYAQIGATLGSTL